MENPNIILTVKRLKNKDKATSYKVLTLPKTSIVVVTMGGSVGAFVAASVGAFVVATAGALVGASVGSCLNSEFWVVAAA